MDINNINRDRDTSGLGPIEYDQTKVPALIRKHANYVRTKTYGQQVREAQARNAEVAGLVANEAVDISNATNARQSNLENTFDSLQQEMTDKDVISAPEIIAARGGLPQLGDRLDATDAQLAQTAINALNAGMVGDNYTDSTNEFVTANESADNNKLFFPNGVYKIKNSEPIDLNFSGFTGNDVTIDLSESTAVPTFRVKGTRELVRGGLTLKKGDCEIPNIDYVFKKGDVIIITSNQPLPTYSQSPSNRPFYQGERHIVDSYDVLTKTLRITGHFEFDYTLEYSGAYVYKVNQKSFTIPEGIKFIGNEGGHQRLFELIHTDFDIAASFSRFGESSLKTFGSVGKFNGKIYSGYKAGSSTAYGIQVCDLSDVTINAQIYGSKHCVSGGGGGHYRTNDFGVEGPACYPAKYNIIGGTYVNTNEEEGYLNTYPAIDAHGNMKEAIVTGANIHGGIKLNADYSLATGNIISIFDSAAFLGAEVETSNNPDWGSLKFNNNQIYVLSTLENPSSKEFMRVKGNYRSVIINDNEFHGNFASGVAPMDLNINARFFEFERNTIDISSDFQMIINTQSDINFNDNKISGVSTYIVVQSSGVVVNFSRNKIKKSKLSGAYIRGIQLIEKVILKDNDVSESDLSGVRVDNTKHLVTQQNNLLNNGKNIDRGITSRCGLEARQVAELTLDDNDLRDLISSPTQSYGVYHSAHDEIETSVMWTDNRMEGVQSDIGYVLAGKIKRQRGNKANKPIPDYIEGSDGSMFRINNSGTLEAVVQ